MAWISNKRGNQVFGLDLSRLQFLFGTIVSYTNCTVEVSLMVRDEILRPLNLTPSLTRLLLGVLSKKIVNSDKEPFSQSPAPFREGPSIPSSWTTLWVPAHSQIYKTCGQLGKLQCPFQHLGEGKELIYCFLTWMETALLLWGSTSSHNLPSSSQV